MQGSNDASRAALTARWQVVLGCVCCVLCDFCDLCAV